MHAALAKNQNSSVIERLLASFVVTAGAVGFGIVWYFNPSSVNFLPVCPLYSLTGFACPGCGLTRGFHALFHGDVLTALGFNALIPLFIIVFGFFFISMGFVAVRGRGIRVPGYSPNALWVFLVLLLAFGVVRNLPVYPFTVLFP